MPDKELSHEDFVRKAIASLRTGKHKGILLHNTGFSEAFAKLFREDDLTDVVNSLSSQKKIILKKMKKGIRIYLPEDAPAQVVGTSAKVLGRMGLSLDTAEKITHEEFIKKAIVTLRKDNYKGIHSVYSGFNEAFKAYYGGEDPVKTTNALAKESTIAIRPVKGGVMIYLPEDIPHADAGEEALRKMGLR